MSTPPLVLLPLADVRKSALRATLALFLASLLLSLASLYFYDGLFDHVPYNKTPLSIFFIVTYSVATCAVLVPLLRTSRIPSILTIRTSLSPRDCSTRILYLVILSLIILSTLSAVLGPLRTSLHGLSLLLMLPVFLIATKFPLLYLTLRFRSLNITVILLVILYYMTLGFLSGSKMVIVYIVYLLLLYRSYKLILALVPLLLTSFSLFYFANSVSESIASTSSVELSDFFGVFLKRFDSLRSFHVIFDYALSPSFSRFSALNAIYSLFPSCDFDLGCLNTTAFVNESIFSLDPSAATIELSILGESMLFFPPVIDILYVAVSIVLSVLFFQGLSLRFSRHKLYFPASMLAFFNLPSSIFSAGLISTRLLPSFLIELFFLYAILYISTRAIKFN